MRMRPPAPGRKPIFENARKVAHRFHEGAICRWRATGDLGVIAAMARFADKVALVLHPGTPIADAVAAQLRQDGATLVPVAAGFDVASPSAWEQLLGEMTRLDILATIAVAAYPSPQSIAATSLADFRAVVRPNLEGAFLATRYALLKMRAFGNGGVMVNVASAYATVGAADQAAMSASANGIRMMTKSAALACAEANDGIRVNGVAAGPQATPEHIAKAVTFLASDASSYVSGFTLPVDRGFLAK